MIEPRAIRFATVCSGIEAPSLAWHPLGWEPVFFSEVDAFPSAVLAHHYPRVPNLGDMTKFREWPDAAFDVLAGGTPCQPFSTAGNRRGLADPRGNLALTFLAIADRYRPSWLFWENVPGILSQDGGQAFAAFLGALGECGYGWAYRVLDAQYAGVPQRRRRVFVVGYLGSWACATAVLFDGASMRGDSPPGRGAQAEVAAPVASCSRGGSGYRNDADTAASLVANCVNTRPGGRMDPNGETYVTAFNARQDPDHGAVTHPLDTDGHSIAIAFAENSRAELRIEGGDGQRTGALSTGGGKMGQCVPAIMTEAQVRRLTPEECEALQGMPKGYTAITYRGKPAADAPRYRAIGNSMAVPCVSWIGKRIALVEALLQEAA